MAIKLEDKILALVARKAMGAKEVAIELGFGHDYTRTVLASLHKKGLIYIDSFGPYNTPFYLTQDLEDPIEDAEVEESSHEIDDSNQNVKTFTAPMDFASFFVKPKVELDPLNALKVELARAQAIDPQAESAQIATDLIKRIIAELDLNKAVNTHRVKVFEDGQLKRIKAEFEAKKPTESKIEKEFIERNQHELF